MESVADRISYEVYFKLLLRRNRPYLHIFVRSKYAKIDRNGSANTELIKRLTRGNKKA